VPDKLEKLAPRIKQDLLNASEIFLKFLKKPAHCLSIEEETYDWAPAKPSISTRMVVIFTLMMTGLVLFVSLA
jgi:hypothetical protein